MPIAIRLTTVIFRSLNGIIMHTWHHIMVYLVTDAECISEIYSIFFFSHLSILFNCIDNVYRVHSESIQTPLLFTHFVTLLPYSKID